MSSWTSRVRPLARTPSYRLDGTAATVELICSPIRDEKSEVEATPGHVLRSARTRNSVATQPGARASWASPTHPTQIRPAYRRARGEFGWRAGIERGVEDPHSDAGSVIRRYNTLILVNFFVIGLLVALYTYFWEPLQIAVLAVTGMVMFYTREWVHNDPHQARRCGGPRLRADGNDLTLLRCRHAGRLDFQGSVLVRHRHRPCAPIRSEPAPP